MVTIKEYALRMPKEYVSVSTRLPKTDALFLENSCKRENKTPSEYIRDLIQKNSHSPKNTFLSGQNKIKYNKTTNSFNWIVQLDFGQEVEVLSNLSLEFLKNFQNEIQESIKERNQWVHQTKDDSVDIPKELVGGEDEGI